MLADVARASGRRSLRVKSACAPLAPGSAPSDSRGPPSTLPAYEVVRRRRAVDDVTLTVDDRLVDVPDRSERRREVDAARLCLGFHRIDAGRIEVAGERRHALAGTPPREHGLGDRLPDDAPARATRRSRQRGRRAHVRRAPASSRACSGSPWPCARSGGRQEAARGPRARRARGRARLAGVLPLGQLRLLAIARALAQRPAAAPRRACGRPARGEKARLIEALQELETAAG